MASPDKLSVFEGVSIAPFSAAWQGAAETLIESGLAERWGSNDPNLNPDIRDIASSYPGDQMFLALKHGELIATGAVVTESATRARVVRMSVASHCRGQGIGKLVLSHLEDVARQRDFDEMVLETTETWQDAIGFYQSQGYQLLRYADGDAHFLKKL